jgi:outer membrane protein OmpA-like peptidoglycan-associated protein
MQLINGRTPEQWRAYDRWKLIVAVVLAALLLLMWLAGRGPGRAAACCAVPEPAVAAAVTPPVATPLPEPPGSAAPDTPPPPPPEAECPDLAAMKVLFASNSAAVAAEGRTTLEHLAPCLGEGRYEVAGHADSSGTDAINEPLALSRAETVVRVLVREGVEASRLEARGYAATQPLVDNATPEGRARNRRVQIRAH